ncbi:hypothetical protein ACFE6N_20775 [Pedobacter sp. BG31]|uniref:hypothetical protein n=1 Tax=Pedobacter sp. BG31 TaxID=3349697 RepID=UPI0035F35E54
MNMEEFCKTFKKHPIAWTLFIIFVVGWLLPLVGMIFLDPPSEKFTYQKGQHNPTVGLFTVSVFYFLINLTLGFIGKKNNIYLKLSAYIGISSALFMAISNGL